MALEQSIEDELFAARDKEFLHLWEPYFHFTQSTEFYNVSFCNSICVCVRVLRHIQ